MHDRQRYVVRSVSIQNAPTVEESELLKMTIPEPRVRKATGDSAKKLDTNNSNNPTASSLNQQKSDTGSKPQKKKKKKKNKKRPKARKATSDVVSLKTGFSQSFATSTQTLGSIQGCLRRALLPAGESGRIARLSNDDIKTIADRIEAAVAAMAEARIFVCRMLDIMVYDALLKQPTPGATSEEDFDVLDLLMEKSAGISIIKYLFSLTLNGKIDNRGPKIRKDKIKVAKKMAEACFERLIQIVPGFKAINKCCISLGRLIVDAAMEMGVQLRKHFKNIPFTIGGRVSSSVYLSHCALSLLHLSAYYLCIMVINACIPLC